MYVRYFDICSWDVRSSVYILRYVPASSFPLWISTDNTGHATAGMEVYSTEMCVTLALLVFFHVKRSVQNPDLWREGLGRDVWGWAQEV